MSYSYEDVQARMAEQQHFAERRRMTAHARKRHGVRFVTYVRRRVRPDGLGECTE